MRFQYYSHLRCIAYCLVGLCLLAGNAFAQDDNIILNGGFEDICLQKGMRYITHPDSRRDTLYYPNESKPKNRFSIQDLRYSPVGVRGWLYYYWEGDNDCGSGGWYSNMGYAHQGNVFGIIRVYEEREIWERFNGYINNLTATFCRPLTGGKQYELSFYIKAFSGNRLTDRIGMAFLETPVSFQYSLPEAQAYFEEILRGAPPPKQQHIEADLGFDTIISNTETYQQVSFTYTARGGEQYLHIGNLYFEDSSFWTAQHWEHVPQFGHYPNKDNWQMCYYAIDDVTLIPVDTVEILCPVEEVVQGMLEDSIFIQTVYYDNDGFHNSQMVEVIVESINSVPEGYSIMIEGHTDHKGSDEYNLVLSQKRVEEMAHVLYGLVNKPMQMKAMGSSRPKYTGEQSHLNRRVDIYLLRKEDGQ